MVYRWRVWKDLHAGPSCKKPHRNATTCFNTHCFFAHRHPAHSGQTVGGRGEKLQLLGETTASGSSGTLLIYFFLFFFLIFITKTLKRCDARLLVQH